MCGITGFWDISRQIGHESLSITVRQMSDTLFLRGPDDSGVWIDTDRGIALGHRRLAIIDLSPLGHQPMHSADGRYVIVFNGEIYNFQQLRKQLESLGHTFRGHSDTEIMLAAFCEWGVLEATKRFNGMFAFALWDRQERVLHLGRDRMGEKPLYYGWIGQTLVFASELKAFKAYPHFQPEIDRDALAAFLRYSYIPAPYSIYKNIYKLPPATILSWNGINAYPQPQPYWSMKEVAELGITQQFPGSEAEAIEQIESLLKDAVGLRMMADVPLGAFLSGGIDSSTVVALMQSQSSQPIKTFTIGFNEKGYNEAEYAKAVAQHLGTNHTELYLSADNALAVIPKLPQLYDEPFSDVSQIPTFLVSQLAREHVTVSLSGDGGDELFAGYSRYFFANNLWNKIAWMPKPVRQAIAHALKGLSHPSFSHIGPTAIGKKNYSSLARYIENGSKVMAMTEADTLYTHVISHWKQPTSIVRDSSEIFTSIRDRNQWANIPEFIQQMMYVDSVSYLPDDILVKLDRASMGVSLEGRIPFLDHRVVELAWQMPLSLKVRQNQSKWLLRKILYKYVPSALIDRPKMGFNVPIGNWLRGSLRDWSESLLDEKKLQQQGFLNFKPIHQKWQEHLRGESNWEYYLWDILMFQAWLETH